MKFQSSEKGQVLIMVAFAAIALFAFAALAIDGSMYLSDRRHAQNAADTSAIAAALARTRGQNYTNAAMARAASNGYDNGTLNDVVVTIANSPGGCPHNGKDITVTITSTINTTFARVIGRTQLTNIVSATARSCDILLIQNTPFYKGSAVFATKTGICNGSNAAALYVNGSGNLQFWGGDLGSASTDPNCLRFQGGQTQLKMAEKGTDCADILSGAGSGGTFNGVTGQDGCGAKVYNQSFENPPGDLGITCSSNAIQSGSTMTAGNYTGSFPPAGVTTLLPGTYCINGDFRVNAGQQLTGTNVTIVMNSGTLKWNGSSEVSLSAPTDPNNPLKGLVIYAPPSNSFASGNNEINIDGSGNASITGTVLAENLPCYFAGSGQIQKTIMQFICYTWGMDGNGQGEIVYDSSYYYTPTRWIDPSISLVR